jgi:hypothetical protein
MAKNRSQLVTVVADALGKAQAATAISGAQLGERCIDFINWGQHRIARYYSFDELNALIESATTVASTKRYPLITGTNNLGLTRPKDITTVRLIDDHNSTKLERWSIRKFDAQYPYPENYAEQRPSIYIRWNNNIDLFRIPDDAYTLHIRYPQWPQDLATDGQTPDFEYKDQLIITAAILEGYLHFEEYESASSWFKTFMGLLGEHIKAVGNVDWSPDAEPFSTNPGGYTSGEPWLDPYATPTDALYGYPD